MLFQGKARRIVLLIALVGFFSLPIAISLLQNQQTPVSVVISQNIAQANDEGSGEPLSEASAENASAQAGDVPPPADVPVQEPPAQEEPAPLEATAAPPQPTAAPTEAPTTAPTETPTSVPTTAPTDAPSVTPVPAEQTPEPTTPPTDTPIGEATAEATEEATQAVEPPVESTPELTEEPVLAAPGLSGTAACTGSGAAFTITNDGGDMPAPEPYALDGTPAGEFQLAAGESVTINGGFGAPILTTTSLTLQPATPCASAPQLEVTSTMCVPASGTIFTITNSGGDMTSPLTYSITDQLDAQFQLTAGESIDLLAGFGTPVLTAGDLTFTFEGVCDPVSSIGGIVWLDANGDGLYTPDESTISLAHVVLTNENGVTKEAITADDGAFLFTELALEHYSLRVTTPEGSDLVAGYDADGGSDAITSISLTRDPVSTDFGFEPAPRGTVSGGVWADLNGDGIRDSGEPTLSGIVVSLMGADGEQQAATAANGSYLFADLNAGSYTLQVMADALRGGYEPTFDADGGADGTSVVRIDGNILPDFSFGLRPTHLVSISGLVWLETGNFGTRDASETGISGIVLSLMNQNGDVVQTFTVAEDGAYTFTDLLPGMYTVAIDTTTLPDRLFVTHNHDGSSAFTTLVDLQSGTDAQGLEFGLVGAF